MGFETILMWFKVYYYSVSKSIVLALATPCSYQAGEVAIRRVVLLALAVGSATALPAQPLHGLLVTLPSCEYCGQTTRSVLLRGRRT